MTFSDPLPGVIHSYSGPDRGQWLRDIPLYATATLEGVFPGVNAQYRLDREGAITLAFQFSPGADLGAVGFHVSGALSTNVRADGGISVQLTRSPSYLSVSFPSPLAIQTGPAGEIGREASFAVGPAGIGFAVPDYDPALPLEIRFAIGNARSGGALEASRDSDGATFAAVRLPDVAGKPDPFPLPFGGPRGCGVLVERQILCSNVAVYKLTPEGEIAYVAYLAGKAWEDVFFVGTSPDGAVVVAGRTNSTDFPVTDGAAQAEYAGPVPSFESYRDNGAGDYFVVKLDADSGALRSSTFLGGPEWDYEGEAQVGADGSVYLSGGAGGMTAFPQLSACGEAYGCRHFFAARLSPSLDEMIFGVYLPGNGRAQAHSDGSVYFVGAGGPEFTATPGAYQEEAASAEDAIFGRLDPSGGLLFATFVGDEGRNSIHELEVLPDGSVWGAVSTYDSEQGRGAMRFVRVDAEGRRLLADYVSGPNYGETLTTDPEGNLIVLASGVSPVTPDALLSSSCSDDGRAYLRIGLTGELLFSTYLPEGAYHTFVGVSERGFPVLGLTQEYFSAPGLSSRVRSRNVEIVED